MPRDFSAGSIAGRKISGICATFGECRFHVAVYRWFCRAISIGDRGNRKFPQSAIPCRSLFSLFHIEMLLHSRCCVVGSPFFCVYSHALFHQAFPYHVHSFLPLLASVVIVAEKYSDPQRCAISGEIDLSLSTLIDIKSYLFMFVSFFLIRYCWHALNWSSRS